MNIRNNEVTLFKYQATLTSTSQPRFELRSCQGQNLRYNLDRGQASIIHTKPLSYTECVIVKTMLLKYWSICHIPMVTMMWQMAFIQYFMHWTMCSSVQKLSHEQLQPFSCRHQTEILKKYTRKPYLIQITTCYLLFHEPSSYINTGSKVHSATVTPTPQFQHAVTADVWQQNVSFRGNASAPERGYRWLAKHCDIRRSTIWCRWWPKKVLLTNTTAHFPLSSRYNNSEKPRYSWERKWGDILSRNYTTFTKRGSFHIYSVITTQIPLNTYTEGDASILCTDKRKQSYCGTNGNLRLCKIS